MNISIRWLSRYVDLSDQRPEDIADNLTMSTAEVEGVTAFAAGLDELVIGHVLERDKHPNADKLSICKVDLGKGEPSQIICGAPNVAAGQRVVVIQPGQVLPDGTKIKKGKIRGEESLGMICSERELGLSEDHEGIIVLDKDYSAGLPLAQVLDCADHVIEIDNKSINHRPDLWGHYGIARELAAILGRELQPWGARLELPASGDSLDLSVEDQSACPRYLGLCVEGVQQQRSPDWMRYLLHAVGQRSINLLVDLTNFVMLDLGQPMHAFDRRQLQGDVTVRRAKAGERMHTLDEIERELQDEDLLITSGGAPVALAGIMGGQGSMVQDDTTSLFLESANFHAATVRRTSTRLGLRTDSSARFEKTLDPALCEEAVHRYLGLLQELCPTAKASGPLCDPAEWSYPGLQVELRRARLDLKLGHVVPDDTVEGILSSLDFGVSKTEAGWAVDIPSFRASKDIAIEDDLIEEVGRMFRYDNIPAVPLVSVVAVPPKDPELALAREMSRCAALELACHEVYNYSFVPDQVLEAVQAGDQEYSIVSNPVAPEICRMRRHVMPSLLAACAPNMRSAEEVRMFEHGKGYQPEHKDADGLPQETRELALVWSRKGGDPYPELRSAVLGMLSRQGFPVSADDLSSATETRWVHPQKTVALTLADQEVGYLGSLHPQVARNLEMPSTTAICSLDLRALLRAGKSEKHFVEMSRFPPQPVDVALLVPDAVQVKTCVEFLHKAGRKLVQGVELFEVYRGQGVPAGHKSLNFTVTLGASDRTLSGKDEEKYLSKVRQGVAEIGGELRG